MKDIRDKALAMQAYARQAQDNELQIWAGEIKMRAERRAGQMLKDMDKTKRGRPKLSGTQTVPLNHTPTLSDLNVTKNQSSQWQKVANVSEEEFEEHIAGDVAKGKAPSSTAILRDEARKERVENIAEVSEGNTELSTEKTYPIIYADPPWRYENPPVGATNRAIENHSQHIFVGGVSPSGKLIGG